MNSTALNNELGQYADLVNDFMSDYFKDKREVLHNASYHYIKAGGKRIRPYIFFKCFELINSDDIEPVIPIGAAVEVFHTFSLVHDDIMDDDDERRGVEAVHLKWGESMAILAGDFLLGLANVMISGSGLGNSVKSEIVKELGDISLKICEGQAKDMEMPGIAEVTLEEYFSMISLKTAALFEKCGLIGGISAGASSEQVHALGNYSLNLGMAFQIYDDLLDVTAESVELGKPAISDIANNKKTILVLTARELLTGIEREEFETTIAAENIKSSDIEKIILLIKKSGAIEETRTFAEKYILKAKDSLKEFNRNDTLDSLLAIADFVINREK